MFVFEVCHFQNKFKQEKMTEQCISEMILKNNQIAQNGKIFYTIYIEPTSNQLTIEEVVHLRKPPAFVQDQNFELSMYNYEVDKGYIIAQTCS